jgi:hypothetical protein
MKQKYPYKLAKTGCEWFRENEISKLAGKEKCTFLNRQNLVETGCYWQKIQFPTKWLKPNFLALTQKLIFKT